MTGSQTTAAADSPSTTDRPAVTAPPLRVTTPPSPGPAPAEPSSSSIPSPTTPAAVGDTDGWDLPPDPVDESSSTRLSDEPKPAAPEGLSLKEIARGLVLAASLRIGQAIGKDDGAAVEAFVAGEKEQRAIGDPLARIGARHMKTTGAGNPDIADLIVAGIAAAGYAFRAVTGLINLKRARDALAKATAEPAETAAGGGV